MAKHTPGPWFVVKGDEWTSDIATETPEQGIWTVASANKRRDEFEANKRLISAAPDMLAALRALVEDENCHSDFCSARVGPIGQGWTEAKLCDCPIKEALAAISKAEG